jgi:hypothetical protein
MARKKKILSLDEIKEQVQEARAIIGSVVHRWRQGKMVMVAVNGEPGTGKSYLCMRAAELIYKQLGFGKLEKRHIVTKDIDLLGLLLNAEKGTVVIVEEASVLFNARRATSGENVAFSMIVDTCRKKGLILFLNFPFSDSLDKHGRHMASHSIETQQLHKEKEMCLARVLKLQYNDRIKKLYRKHLKVRVGKRIERISKVWFGAPEDKEVVAEYEESKDLFLKELYERKLKEAENRKNKKDRELNGPEKIEKSNIKTVKQQKRLDRNNRIVELIGQGELTKQEISKLVGITNVRLSQILKELKQDGYEI